MTHEILRDVPVRQVGGKDAFSGISFGEEVRSPFRVQRPEAEEWGEIRKMTGDLGDLCEENVLGIWGGTQLDLMGETSDVIQRIDAARQALMMEEVEFDCFTSEGAGVRKLRLVDLADETFRHCDIAPFYQELAGESEDIFEVAGPQNRHLCTVFEGIDSVLGIDLMGMYASLPLVGGVISSHARYLVEASLVLAKEVCHPTYEFSADVLDSMLIADVRCGSYQFDAILVAGGGGDASVFSQKPCNLYELLKLNRPYSIYEVKLPFRTCHTTGKNKLRKPIRRHLRSFYRRVGDIALSWERREGTPFPFPTYFDIAYLRGTLPHVIHRVRLNDIFFRDWAEFLKERLKRGLVIDADTAKDVGELVGILDYAGERLQQERHARFRESVEKLRKDIKRGFTQADMF